MHLWGQCYYCNTLWVIAQFTRDRDMIPSSKSHHTIISCLISKPWRFHYIHLQPWLFFGFPQCLIMCCLHIIHFHRINQARKGSRSLWESNLHYSVCRQSPLTTEPSQSHFRLVYRLYCILFLCCSLAASDYGSLNTCNFYIHWHSLRAVCQRIPHIRHYF